MRWPCVNLDARLPCLRPTTDHRQIWPGHLNKQVQQTTIFLSAADQLHPSPANTRAKCSILIDADLKYRNRNVSQPINSAEVADEGASKQIWLNPEMHVSRLSTEVCLPACYLSTCSARWRTNTETVSANIVVASSERCKLVPFNELSMLLAGRTRKFVGSTSNRVDRPTTLSCYWI